jgi:myo-inositol-1(or 4)-monophosphatase
MQQSDCSADLTTLEALERTAVRLARLAGEQICSDLGTRPDVDFKAPWAGASANANPVSQTDRRIERLIREQLAGEHPAHAIIGEEYPASEAGAAVAPFTWVVDPVDGTTNYINGVPLFASAIGVLFRGRPVAGAIWCAATHALRPGIYHAHCGGPLHFDGAPLERRSAGAWRGLASEPGRAPTYGRLWDTRMFGCATLEIALVAAGLLRLAYIPRPALWDVVAGLVLLQAAHCHALTLSGPRPDTLLYFSGSSSPGTLARWSEPLLIGDKAALDLALAEGQHCT